jgi:hypothetical protein
MVDGILSSVTMCTDISNIDIFSKQTGLLSNKVPLSWHVKFCWNDGYNRFKNIWVGHETELFKKK